MTKMDKNNVNKDSKSFMIKLKRIAAWVILAGFILLLINILFIGYQLFISGLIYIAVAGVFLLTMKKKKRQQCDMEANGGNNSDDGK